LLYPDGLFSGFLFLEEVRWSLAERASGWGLDNLWPVLLPYPRDTLAIIDQVVLAHTRPGRASTPYTALRQQGVNPGEELACIIPRFRLPSSPYAEFGGVALPLDIHPVPEERPREEGFRKSG
jgi:hypothetical protein